MEKVLPTELCPQCFMCVALPGTLREPFGNQAQITKKPVRSDPRPEGRAPLHSKLHPPPCTPPRPWIHWRLHTANPGSPCHLRVMHLLRERWRAGRDANSTRDDPREPRRTAGSPRGPDPPHTHSMRIHLNWHHRRIVFLQASE